MLNFWSSDKQWREGNFWWVIGKRDDVAGKGERKNMSFLFPHPIPARSISNIAAWWMIPAFNLCTLITAGYGYGHLILGGEVFKARFCLNFENLVKTLSQHVITNGFPPLGTSCLHTVLVDLNILTHWRLNEIAHDPPLIPWRFLEFFRASESTKINYMRSKHRHKIRFQDVVYSKSNKWRAKILKKISKKTSTCCVKLIRKQEIISFLYRATKCPTKAEKIEYEKRN